MFIWGSRRSYGVFVALTALAGWVGPAAPAAEPVLYVGEGGWGVITGFPASARPPDSQWRFEDGVWVGRLPVGTDTLKWGRQTWALPEAQPPPVAPAELPAVRNPFGPCVVHSLSVRFDSVARSRRWSLVFAPEGQEPDFHPVVFPDGRSVGLALILEDVESGRRRELRPARQGREANPQNRPGEDPWFYAGALDEGRLEWSLVVVPGKNGRRILQGRILAMDDVNRCLRLRVLVRAGSPGIPVLQEESPPAVVAAAAGRAVALFADLAEPRRFRPVSDVPDAAGLEFDLAVTRAMGNFPRSATFSVELDSWAQEDAAGAGQEAVARLGHAGGRVPVPEAVLRGESAALAVLTPSRMEVTHPGGFRHSADVMQYLTLKTGGLFAERDWAHSALSCAVQNSAGEPRIELDGDRAVVHVNADPDLPTMLAMGPNRGRTVLGRIRRSGARAVLIRAAESTPGLDHSGRALQLGDYPALWEPGTAAPGVDPRHAEIELIGALACVLKNEGICLLVQDSGPLAPFTTYYADALVCASADPAEMRRQRALAGPRPVLWLPPETAGSAAVDMARNLRFVTPGPIADN